MNDDNFWEGIRTKKFVVVPIDLRGPPVIGHVILMSDKEFWSDHADECIAWCSENSCHFEGMTICIPDDQTLSHFLLRWG